MREDCYPHAQMRKATSTEVTKYCQKVVEPGFESWLVWSQSIIPSTVQNSVTCLFSFLLSCLIYCCPLQRRLAYLEPHASRPLSLCSLWQECPPSISAHQFLPTLQRQPPQSQETDIIASPRDSNCISLACCTCCCLMSYLCRIFISPLVQWRQTVSHASLNMVPDTYFEFNKYLLNEWIKEWEKCWWSGQDLIKMTATTNPHWGSPNLSVDRGRAPRDSAVPDRQLSSVAWQFWDNSGNQSEEEWQGIIRAECQSKSWETQGISSVPTLSYTVTLDKSLHFVGPQLHHL